MMGHLYRDPSDGLGRLRAELYRQRLNELEELPRGLRRLYTRRIARTAAGAAAFAGMSAVFLLALIALVDGPMDPTSVGAAELGGATMSVWVLSLLTYVVARVVAASHFRRRVTGLLEVSGEVYRDVDLLRAPLPQRAVELVSRHERASIAWPLMGAAMLLPLLLHWGVYALHRGAVPAAGEFGFWIALSAVTVSHSHLVLAYCARRFAQELSRSSLERMDRLDVYGFRALGLTIASSLLPGLVLVGIPCILVGLTGLVFVPATFWSVVSRVRRERLALAEISG